jgi:hypothetical protein
MKRFSFVMIATFCAMNLGFVGQTSAQSILDQIKNVATEVATNSDSGSTVSTILNNVIGSSKIAEKDLVGTWRYSSSSCAFSSENLLAKAGGAYAAQRIQNKLNPSFQKLGINSNNTQFVFNNDKTFTANMYGHKFTGTYTYDANKGKLKLQGLLLSTTCYVTKSGSNMNFLFDSSKLLTLMQTVSRFSGNSTLSTIGSLAKNYNGCKMGFMMRK